MKYKAIISDIDGTLTAIGANALPTKNVIDTIRKAEEKGIIFTLATARPLFLLHYLLEHMKTDVLIIIDNGAAIYDTAKKKVLWETTLNPDLINKLLGIFNSVKKKRVNLDLSDGTFISDVKQVDSHIRVRKLVGIGLSSQDADTLVSDLEEKFKTLSISKGASFSGENLFDVYVANADATKQHAVLKLAEILNISTHEIIGIGDHYNDFPLLMACGFKVAMGNAVPELKEIADYVAPSVEEDGLAHVIEKFVLKDNE